MGSPSESRNMAAEDAEVTSEHRNPEMGGHHQLLPPPEGREQEATAAASRQFDAAEFPLGRQTSIYSLTLDEIQNTVCEPGMTFGSMNMDEFLTNIWNVEEVQVGGGAAATAAAGDLTGGGAGGALAAEPLRRQGSLTLPAALSRKTVDEVWADIHREAALRSQQAERIHQDDGIGNAGRQPTFGEMTLENFLIKAGVVREGYVGGPGEPPPQPQPMVATPPAPSAAAQQYGMAGPGHLMGMGYPEHPGLGATGNGGYTGRIGNGYGAAGATGSPPSPVSSEGMGGGQVDNSAMSGYMAEGARSGGSLSGGRKRPADGAGVDKVVERRQRRMIKNRESAARSRARKQAYTVELEAELNQLKEENTRLREEQLVETMAEQARINAQKVAKRLRRCNSSTW